MHPIQEPITGKENQGDLSSPYQALVQFYCAFNSRNMQMMSENWAQSDEIAMDNPLGGIKRGWEEIKAVYERLFNGPAKVYVEFYDYTIHEASEMFYAVGRERGEFRIGETVVNLAIRTSRVFRLIDGRWCQVHHHGSIDDPELLARYQAAVVGGKASPWVLHSPLNRNRHSSHLAEAFLKPFLVNISFHLKRHAYPEGSLTDSKLMIKDVYKCL